MRTRRILTLAGIGIVGCLSVWRAGGAEPPKMRVWDFDKDKAGEVAQGFAAESGEWKVVADESAPSKGQVLAQLAQNESSAFNIVFLKDLSVKQLDLSVKFKTIAGKEDQGGGLVWRAKDAKNYFLCRYNPLEENLRFYKVVDGKRTVIESLDIASAQGWHTLKIVMKDARITAFLDGVSRASLMNDTFMDAGRIGLWTKADAQTHFDDFSFTAME